MIEIDGSLGEGGGQVLRSALTLSLITGQATRIIRIRAHRPKSGLAAQHLAAIRAAAQVGQAEIKGARLGAARIVFRPGSLRAGDFSWDIGTAGSTSLVLQTVLLPLSLADSTSTVRVTGGTHVKWSPCHHYLEELWIPALRKLGLEIDLTLEKAGFYPRGGGAVRATVHSRQDASAALSPMSLTDPGQLLRIRGTSLVANLPDSIAERQRRQASARLEGAGCPVDISAGRMPARGKGTLISLVAELEHTRACYFGLGELGKPAERVADEAADAMLAFLSSGAGVDEYLADQLLLPLAFASGPSELRTAQVTGHLLTNAEVISAFGAAQVEVEGELGEVGLIRVRPT